MFKNQENQATVKKKEVMPSLKPHQKQSCPSPPQVLKDKKSSVQFTKGKFLGEGGFARCYEVWDSNGARFAAKVVPKSALKTEKTKQKLFAEIKIHQSLSHKNIVRFHHVFEDQTNVYMILELCEGHSLVEMLKKRKRLTEPEVRYYIMQIMESLIYLCRKHIIHRDIKLGNLFLTKNMEIRIGDFGLATTVNEDGDRRKTICGTPNYIAPEVLFDRDVGHSYEVDIWSTGVVLYTLLIGKPPFQTKDIKQIYSNIRENRYEFPADIQISSLAKQLITQMLSPRACDRPTAMDVFQHPWCRGSVPKYIPVSALTELPELEFVTQEVVVIEDSPTASSASKQSSSLVNRRTPLSDVNSRRLGPVNLIPSGVQNNENENRYHNMESDMNITRPQQKTVQLNKDNALMSPKTISGTRPAAHFSPAVEQLRRLALHNKSPSRPPFQADNVTPSVDSLQSKLEMSPTINPVRKTMLETMLFHLNNTLSCIKKGTTYQTNISSNLIVTPKVFMSKWIDYSNKYGLGYQLTNGHIGVFFNDSSSIILSANDSNFEYLEYAKGSEKTVMNRHGYTLENYPEDIKKKAILLKHFKGYMTQNLAKASNYTFQDTQRTTNMDFLVKYIRTKHAVMFRLTNRVVQINFFDHSKLILSQDGQVVTFIDREKELTTFALSEVLQRQKSDVVSRLKYASDILESLTSGKDAASPRQGGNGLKK